MSKDNRLKLRSLKGWPSFVWGYKEKVKNWDNIDWDGEGTMKPKKVEITGINRTRITF